MIQELTELPQYCQNYLQELSPEISYTNSSVNNALEFSFDKTKNLFHDLLDEYKDFAYAEHKWTVSELIGHLLDCERIFVYRALTIAREQNPPTIDGFDENLYTQNSNYHLRKFNSLKDEYLALQKATGYFFEGLTDIELTKKGFTSGYSVTPRTIGMLISAHRLHHIAIIKNRYLSNNI